MNRPNVFRRATDRVASFVRDRVEWTRGEARSRGASAVEWVIISAIVAALVAGIGVVISNALDSKTDTVKNCIQNASKTTDC
ncbi:MULTISPECIES: Flp family type IVb pilin [unclassified Streptomyces]|uniref:Flp family type IVb pilin n=1 Tax=unclassified Streptomyces TaxID=2593676 RepID=UPI002E27E28F|nr:hypothetical protein [Streptomyces sp. NBC_00223]